MTNKQENQAGKVNAGFENFESSNHKNLPEQLKDFSNCKDLEDGQTERAVWGNQIEFLMSCIATSVGLGNVWRFPFTAYRNGGGAFLIPYILVLIFIGKPMYYLECYLGQFSSRNAVKVWVLAPGMKGIGYAQSLGCSYVLSYYVPIIAICIFYFTMSFQSTLPWAFCDPEWKNCVPSSLTKDIVLSENSTSSAELYFTKTVLQLSGGIDSGLGLPVWYLMLCLFGAWFIIFLIVSRGIKSSGKASYFLAIFPYVIMIILLISTLMLPGSGNGILFFLTPQWEALASLRVWYAAVTQVFFSLSVCTGPLIMFSSYNNFRQNIYRDAIIVTTLDTFTSLLSGITIFGILGNLAYILNQEVGDVVGTGGTGLAFISYPDAIAKTIQPQIYIPETVYIFFFIYRDAIIVTTLDTFTSLLSGITIFGILGNLAYILNQEVGDVVGTGGTGLAFISYPDAIAKTIQPQVFSILFFLMMIVLGIGSAVALLSTVNTILLDAFPRVKTIFLSAFSCTVGFAVGLIYVTPGGQYILELTDYFGGTFLILFCGIFEVCVVWIYGVENICLDIEFMLDIKTSFYWRFCWGIITPTMMIIVFIYAVIAADPLEFGNYEYPTAAYVAGYFMVITGVLFVPLFMCTVMFKNKTAGSFMNMLKKSLDKKSSWGPRLAIVQNEWRIFKENAKMERLHTRTSWINHYWQILTGGYRIIDIALNRPNNN